MRSPVLRRAAFAALGQTRLLHAFGERGSARGEGSVPGWLDNAYGHGGNPENAGAHTRKGEMKLLSHLGYSADGNRLAPTRIRAQ